MITHPFRDVAPNEESETLGFGGGGHRSDDGFSEGDELCNEISWCAGEGDAIIGEIVCGPFLGQEVAVIVRMEWFDDELVSEDVIACDISPRLAYDGGLRGIDHADEEQDRALGGGRKAGLAGDKHQGFMLLFFGVEGKNKAKDICWYETREDFELLADDGFSLLGWCGIVGMSAVPFFKHVLDQFLFYGFVLFGRFFEISGGGDVCAELLLVVGIGLVDIGEDEDVVLGSKDRAVAGAVRFVSVEEGGDRPAGIVEMLEGVVMIVKILPDDVGRTAGDGVVEVRSFPFMVADEPAFLCLNWSHGSFGYRTRSEVALRIVNTCVWELVIGIGGNAVEFLQRRKRKF